MLPLSVIHYSHEDPRTSIGGVQGFARNLERLFAEVRYLTPGSRNRRAALTSRVPIICDNQLVLDWPPEHPVIGFQHGVAAVKYQATGSLGHWRLARAQRRAAARPNTLWVACARWIAEAFGALHGNAARTSSITRSIRPASTAAGRTRTPACCCTTPGLGTKVAISSPGSRRRCPSGASSRSIARRRRSPSECVTPGPSSI
jgi:hypothetical protein